MFKFDLRVYSVLPCLLTVEENVCIAKRKRNIILDMLDILLTVFNIFVRIIKLKKYYRYHENSVLYVKPCKKRKVRNTTPKI